MTMISHLVVKLFNGDVLEDRKTIKELTKAIGLYVSSFCLTAPELGNKSLKRSLGLHVLFYRKIIFDAIQNPFEPEFEVVRDRVGSLNLIRIGSGHDDRI